MWACEKPENVKMIFMKKIENTCKTRVEDNNLQCFEACSYTKEHSDFYVNLHNFTSMN